MTKTKDSASANSASASSSSSAQIAGSIASTLSSADSSAAQSVHTLTLVHKARIAQLSRTAAALKAQYGPNDAAVKSAEDAVTAAGTTASRVSMVQQELTTAVPEVAANGWAVHGRVFDSKYQPMTKMTVFLVDATNTYQQQLGFAYTDESGYFLISVADAKAQLPGTAPVFMEVADQKGQPVYLSTSSLDPTSGGSLYQNIVLTTQGKPIGGPPKAIRGTAIPAKSRKK